MIRYKYQKEHDFLYWYGKGCIDIPTGSTIWLSLQKIIKIFIQYLSWSMGLGHRILIGTDHILGVGVECNISEEFIRCINGHVFTFGAKSYPLGRVLVLLGKSS